MSPDGVFHRIGRQVVRKKSDFYLDEVGQTGILAGIALNPSNHKPEAIVVFDNDKTTEDRFYLDELTEWVRIIDAN